MAKSKKKAAAVQAAPVTPATVNAGGGGVKGWLSRTWCYIAAFILPVVYLCYKTGCDLKKSTRAERKLLLDAVRDAYHLLMALGYPVRPVGDEKSLEPGLSHAVTFCPDHGAAELRQPQGQRKSSVESNVVSIE